MNRAFVFLLAAAFLSLLSLPGCQQSQTKASSKGVCQDASGASINVTEIFGQWKKLSGYLDGEKSEEELKYNYSVLIVEKGSAICQVSVVNRTAQAVKTSDLEAYIGTYTHNVTNKKVDITYKLGASGAGGDVATYSFGGDCSNPTMTLSYPNNKTLNQETFVLQSKNVAEKSCQGQQ